MIAYLIAPSDASQQEKSKYNIKNEIRQFLNTFLCKMVLKNYPFLILIPDLKSSCRDASVGVISNVLWTILILGYLWVVQFHPHSSSTGSF